VPRTLNEFIAYAIHEVISYIFAVIIILIIVIVVAVYIRSIS
jgi:hypothetical protein